MLMDNVTGWIRKLTEAGVAAIALAVVVQVIFGSGAAFLPGDVIADGFDERNDAVKKMITMAIEACHRQGKYIGICGQGPSDHLDFAEWLLQQKITSISLNPDTVIETWNRLGVL